MPPKRAIRHRLARGAALLFQALLSGALLSGCKDEKRPPAPAPSGVSLNDRVREATEQNLRAAGPAKLLFRGVRVYSQAMPQHMAVCGLLDPFADDPDIFVPFVSIVTVPLSTAPAGPDDAPQYQFEHRIGKTTSEASRVYVAIVDYCWDKGGPDPGPYRSVRPTPPLPDSIPDPARGRLTLDQPKAGAPRGQTLAPLSPAPLSPAPLSAAASATAPDPAAVARPAAPPGSAATSADPMPAAGLVFMRQNANLHSDPHGPSIRVVQQGTALHVFAQSPGGWYQVGDTAPWGWVHESMLDRRP